MATAAYIMWISTAWKSRASWRRLGLEELFERDALVLIEWGERFPRFLPAERTEIRIRAVDHDEREIEVTESL